MSHFSVLVIGPRNEEELAAALQPFHEFECTGAEDQYVQELDITAEKLAEYQESMCTRYKDKEGILHHPGDDRFYREPTPEEVKTHGPFGGCGWSANLSWFSKDWGDGRGYHAKIHFLPEGYEEVEYEMPNIQSFKDYVAEHFAVVESNEQPEIRNNGAHKYCYAQCNENGEIAKIIRRTNPNKKWDWWVIGGRFKGRFIRSTHALPAMGKNLPGFECDSIAMNDIDQHAMGAAGGITAFAVVDARDISKPQWFESGSMGWWGCVSDAKTPETWAAQIKVLLDGLNPETIITMVDCHI